MKSILKTLMILFLTAFLVGCSKSEDPIPEKVDFVKLSLTEYFLSLQWTITSAEYENDINRYTWTLKGTPTPEMEKKGYNGVDKLRLYNLSNATFYSSSKGKTVDSWLILNLYESQYNK